MVKPLGVGEHDRLTNWSAWHEPYTDESTPLSRRLRIIQRHLTDWIDHRPGQLRVLSLCAGDGRDLIEVLAERTDAERVGAVLVELTPGLAERARASAADAGLDRVEVRTADAGDPRVYGTPSEFDLILLAGVFGNISDNDVQQTISALPALCRPGARVIWTRHRRDPDLTPTIRTWFREAGFTEHAFAAPADAVFTVGVHDFLGGHLPQALPRHLFTFIR